MRNIEIGKTYKHFKGHIYKVIDIVYDADSKGEELEKVVIYESIDDKKMKWARKYDDFASILDKEKYKDVNQTYRFEKIK